MEVGLFSSLASRETRICRIKNTAPLDESWVSEREATPNPKVEMLFQPKVLLFNTAGDLF
jgi:hypothetical protein